MGSSVEWSRFYKVYLESDVEDRAIKDRVIKVFDRVIKDLKGLQISAVPLDRRGRPSPSGIPVRRGVGRGPAGLWRQPEEEDGRGRWADSLWASRMPENVRL